MTRIIRPVAAIATRTNMTGSEIYDIALACGHKTWAVKRRRGSRIDRPRPRRKRCLECEKAAAEGRA